MRFLKIAIFIALLGTVSFSWLNNRPVKVIDAHYGNGAAQVIVDKLPFTDAAKIAWWMNHQEEIRKKYNIPNRQNDPMFITVYAFGDGYKEEGKADRRCFDDMKPPRNCIDKDILMKISRTRDGGIQYDF